jgi:hypothetical protein
MKRIAKENKNGLLKGIGYIINQHPHFDDYYNTDCGFNFLKENLDYYFEPEITKSDIINALKPEINTPSHYDNSKGTLYKVAQERGWNPYLFDIVKRLERAEKKGEFESDLDKSIAVIQLWKNERNTNK